MADEYIYFLFNQEGSFIQSSLRRPRVQPGWKCLAVFADRLIVGAEEQK